MPAIDETTTDPTRPVIDDSGSLSDHESQFNAPRGEKPVKAAIAEIVPAIAEPAAESVVEAPESQTAEEEARDPNGRFRSGKKHRAKDIATPADVPRIRELSSEVKTLKAELEKLRSAPAPVLSPPIEPAREPVRSAAVAEKFAYPSYEASLAKDPTLDYEAWQESKANALWEWRDAQKEQANKARDEQTRELQTRQEVESRQKQLKDAYLERQKAFESATPDFRAVVDAAASVNVPPVLETALILADNGPQLVYALAKDPLLFDEAMLLTEGKTLSPTAVASTQRWLTARTTGKTGAVVAPIVKRNPPPPTPVRTGSMQTGTPTPDDGASLAEHEQFYHKRRR